jgi:acylphosphatase
MKTIKIRITGEVQGVFYRKSVKERATSLGITGTVENRDDGGVELVATGEKNQLDQLVEWCRHGPPKARVENLTVEELSLQEFKNFSISRY